MNMGIVLFDGAEELDFVGPWEVFTMAAKTMETMAPTLEKFESFTVSQNGGTIHCAKGMRVIADKAFKDCPQLDVILLPGGMGTRTEVKNEAMLDFIRNQAAHCRWVTSVCTGSLLLTAAGPAKGKRVTTHWAFVETLRARGEAAEVLDRARYVRDGNVVTAAGVSAGIDMALWLVGQITTPAIAKATQRAMEYDPAPPYTAEI